MEHSAVLEISFIISPSIFFEMVGEHSRHLTQSIDLINADQYDKGHCLARHLITCRFDENLVFHRNKQTTVGSCVGLGAILMDGVTAVTWAGAESMGLVTPVTGL